MKVETKTDTLVVHDTIRTAIPEYIYIDKYIPVIVDSIAYLDTIITVKDSSLNADVSVAVNFDMRELVFENLSIGFPRLEIPINTVYITKEIKVTETIYKKQGILRLIEVGLIGAAVGIVIAR